jgi:hypothetical protein
MMLIKKIPSLLFSPILIFILFIFFLPSPIKAQECSPETSNEDSSLRPYPGDPCYKEIGGALMCGNDLMITDQIVVSPPAGFSGCQKNEGDPRTTKDDTFTCDFQVPRGFSLAVDTSQAELPIAGNTEDELSDIEKVNEYVSWYLNGVIDRTEDWPLTDKSEEDRNKIINFSGPIRKLLPLETQNAARTEQVLAAQGEDQERHNQLVYCSYGFDSIVPDWTQFPGPCDLGTFGNALTWITGTKQEHRLSDWSGKTPPERKDYETFNEYYRAFREWRGDTCLGVKIPEKVLGIDIPIIGGKEFFFCFDNPTQRNFWADTFPFIPFTSTEDRKGELTVSQPVATSTEVTVLNPQYQNVKASVLYFPHLEEDKGLAELLQTTYKAKDLPEEYGAMNPSVARPNCKFLQLRTNSGDSLKGEKASGDFSYTAQFSCTFSGSSLSPSCTKSVTFASKVNTKTPLADEIWKKLVAGTASVVRRMFPKLGTGGLGQIIDYPTVTKATYSADGAKVAAGEAEIYIPHFGGISEYFLTGIQTLLRPKGFGEPITLGSTTTSSGKTDCDKNAADIFLASTLDKDSYNQLALSHVGGQAGTNALECYNDTVRRAIDAGINPAFALVIWLKESDASNYNISQLDFGAAYPSPEGYVNQIEEFFNRAKSYTVNDTRCDWSKLPADKKDNMHVFAWIYRTGRCDPNYRAQDTQAETGEEYYESLKKYWARITTCPFPKSPTDMSCPR